MSTKAEELKGAIYRLSLFSHQLQRPSFLSTARIASRDEHIRETWVRAMETRIVKDMLQECQRVESVNHYENCRELADKYISMMRENQVRSLSSWLFFVRD